MLEADGENQDDYANHVITTLTQELEKMNKYSTHAIIEVDSWISGFSAPTHKDYTGKPFMTVDVTIKPVEGKNIGGDKIQHLNLGHGEFFSAIETMKGLGFYVDFNIVQLPIHCQDKDDPKPFEIQITFYSEF
jgi:hypothetical protein